VTLGAENKKQVAILGVLVVIILVALYMNMSGDSTPAPAPRAVVNTPVPAVNTPVPAVAAPRARAAQPANGGEFRARVLGTRPDDPNVDLPSIDPTLRLDLLAKVQAVEPIEAGRNLFQYGAAPAPPKPLPPVPTGVPQIKTTPQPAPPPSNPAGNQASVKPQAPPITLKYYGYKVSKVDGHKEAFLLDGDDIIFAQENQTVKQHYKVVKIALNAITIEDTQSSNTQTVTLQELPPT